MIKMGMALDPRDLRLINELSLSLDEGDDATILTVYGKIAHLYEHTKDVAFFTAMQTLSERGYNPPDKALSLPPTRELEERLHVKNDLSFSNKLGYLEELCDILLAERTRRELLGKKDFDRVLKRYARALIRTGDQTLMPTLRAYSLNKVKLFPIGALLCSQY